MKEARDWAIAVALWLGMAFSLGWYYTFTYYGRTGIPVPTPESCAALILYYFSVLNVETEIQAIHWMAVFPVAGILWVGALVWLAPRFQTARPPVAATLLRFAAAGLPLVLPGPWMMTVAGATESGFAWDRMLAVALRRGWVQPWPGLNALYVGLGLLALGLQAYAYRRAFALRGSKAWLHAATAGVLLVVAAAVTGALVALPLRWGLE